MPRCVSVGQSNHPLRTSTCDHGLGLRPQPRALLRNGKDMYTQSYSLAELGFSAHFSTQLSLDEFDTLHPCRLFGLSRDRLLACGESGLRPLIPVPPANTGDFAVGDWVLADATGRAVRRLTPINTLSRRAAGTHAATQHIAANVDTLFVVSSCNADFSVARLERYLALARQADVNPVVVLTKADLCATAADFAAQSEPLMPQLTVLTLDATAPQALNTLQPWCGTGQTIALVGSSGVGKTTLMNALTGAAGATQAARDDDDKGRHTTTAREMRRTVSGAWLIDTPGMRALRLHDSRDGLAAVFADIHALAAACRFSDCAHDTEPGCAVQAAIAAGELAEERLQRWRKLQREERHNSETLAESRARDRQFGKYVQRVQAEHNARKGRS